MLSNTFFYKSHAALYLLMRMQQEQSPSKSDLNTLSEIDRMVKEFDNY